jgi:hypothetical protein
MTGTEDPWIIGGTIAAGAAAFIALASLIAILFQIRLARKEIDLVQYDLNNSKKALKYAQEQSTLVQAQMIALSQRPKLQVCGKDGGSVTYSVGQSSIGNNMVPLYYQNVGTRTSKDAQFEIYVPWDLLSGSDRAKDQEYTVEDRAYRRYAWHTPDMSVIWPTHVALGEGNYRMALLANLPEQTEFLWRAYDDYGVHPDSGFGRVTVRMPLA